jgi:crotonobetainyl-CoA:carnitine CoA-transferase CaiB-like acyl-CoA transferase
VESVKRPDLMRFSSVKPPDADQWWEWGALFHSVNVNKRAVTLDLATTEGIDVFERLVATADVLVENFTPRVMDNFGLTWDRLRRLRPSLVYVRMPAFGLDGPWRERTGFAQTMESISGMAWATGRRDATPVLPRGLCDPLAGLHAAIATMLGLRATGEDGEGRLVESTMVEAALNVTAEQLIAWDCSGSVLSRDGSRVGGGAPEGIYRCAGDDVWVAISVDSDAAWSALCELMAFEQEEAWNSAEGRRSCVDALDAMLSQWCQDRDAEVVAASLVEIGVPAGVVQPGAAAISNPQLRHRGFFEIEHHPVTGDHEMPTMPFRFEGIPAWLSRPAPLLGQHNEEVLGEVASPAELEELAGRRIIGWTLSEA